MRFAAEGEEHKYLAANEFIQELKNAPEWLLYTTNQLNGGITLRVRDRSMGPWKDYYSPDPMKMTAEEWLEFVQTIEAVAELRRADILHDMPETHTRS